MVISLFIARFQKYTRIKGHEMSNFYDPLLEKSVNWLPWHMRCFIRHLPGIAWLQRRFFSSFMAGREFTHTINAGPATGLNYPIQLPDDKQIWTGTYETPVANVLRNSVINNSPCYDIGSHRGFLAGVMGVAGASEIHCFEPNPGNVKQLQHLSDLNPDISFVIHDVAISDTSGEANFIAMSESSMGKLSSSPFQHEEKGAEHFSVPMYTLDYLLEMGKIPPPALIKIDVEGAEEKVLSGARHILTTFKPTVVLETHTCTLAKDCIQYLETSGYQVQPLCGGDLQQILKERPVTHWIATAA